jgi:hypothetical protein
MAPPVVISIAFDKTSYTPGDIITATVKYTVPNVHGTSFTLAGTVTDNITHEAGTLDATFAIGVPNTATASVTGGEPGQAWKKVSDDGKSTATFTAVAS